MAEVLVDHTCQTYGSGIYLALVWGFLLLLSTFGGKQDRKDESERDVLQALGQRP